MNSGSTVSNDDYESRKAALKATLRLDELNTEEVRRTLYFHIHVFSRGQCNEPNCVGCDLLHEILEGRQLRLVVDNTKFN